MKDFDLIVKHIEGNEDITIYPISDLHAGAAEFMTNKWNDFKKKIAKEPNSYIILAGDLINNETKSGKSNVFESTMRPSEQKRWVAEQLMDIKDKIICVVPGNHDRRSQRDCDDEPCYDICSKLDIEDVYRENMAFVKIQLGDRRANGDKNPTYTLGVLHGTGGGGMTGSAVNKSEKFGMVIDGLDCLVSGHVHKGFFTKPQKIYIDKYNNKVSLKQFVTVSCTSWVSYGSYALNAAMTPASNDIQTIILHGREKKVELRW
jgi:predicted MPP superfamily phosphohydrolase